VTCPNRDGRKSHGGCIFCGEEGAGFETLPDTLEVAIQLEQNASYIGENYKSKKFIAYFQNYSNTYLPLERFKNYILQACIPNIVAIYISTRPDCICDSQLEFLNHIKKEKGLDIVVELGIQTVNYHTLGWLNRGHGLAEFIDAVLRLKRHEIEACAHYIVDLPMDVLEDVVEGAKILSALGVEQVKCHSLYVLENTVLGKLYKKQEFAPVTMDEYIERIITFLEYLNPEIVVQRLIGRAPKDIALFCNWNTSWRKIYDIIIEKMKNENRFQGSKFNYLNGQACL
jgi:radical SAM protein, TIGR01212 family